MLWLIFFFDFLVFFGKTRLAFGTLFPVHLFVVSILSSDSSELRYFYFFLTAYTGMFGCIRY
jgi:hypothetical protein